MLLTREWKVISGTWQRGEFLMQLHTGAEHLGNVIFRYSELTSQYHIDASIDVYHMWGARDKTIVSQSGIVAVRNSFKRFLSSWIVFSKSNYTTDPSKKKKNLTNYFFSFARFLLYVRYPTVEILFTRNLFRTYQVDRGVWRWQETSPGYEIWL